MPPCQLILKTNVFGKKLFVQAIGMKNAAKKIMRSDHHHLQSVTVVMSFSSKIREVPWENNRLFWSSIKSSFQRIKNREFWRSVWRVMIIWCTLQWRRSLVHVLHWIKGNSTRTEAVATDEEGDDDVKGWLEGCVHKRWWFEVDQSWRQQD